MFGQFFTQGTKIIITLIIATLFSQDMMAQKIEIQGHRGARAIYPENSLPAFEYAQRLGVDVLELDLAVSKDRKLVVSHEPWLSATICMDTTGQIINRNQEREWNLYEMTYEEISQANCGIKPHAAFPRQEKINTIKPLLSAVIEQTIAISNEIGAELPSFNIEIKSLPEGDDIFHPNPTVFSDLVYELIEQSDIAWDKVTIQSFDFRVLKYWNQKYPEVRLVALIENKKSVEENLADLGFRPYVYSPYFKLLNKSTVEYLQEGGMKVIPWTVNDEADLQRMMKMGVDGIISDDPKLALEVRGSFE